MRKLGKICWGGERVWNNFFGELRNRLLPAPLSASWENLCRLFFKPSLMALCLNALSQFFVRAITFSRSPWIPTHLDLGRPPSFISTLHLLSHASALCERVHDWQDLSLQVPSTSASAQHPCLPAALGDLRLILQCWVSTESFHPKTRNRGREGNTAQSARPPGWAASSSSRLSYSKRFVWSESRCSCLVFGTCLGVVWWIKPLGFSGRGLLSSLWGSPPGSDTVDKGFLFGLRRLIMIPMTRSNLQAAEVGPLSPEVQRLGHTKVRRQCPKWQSLEKVSGVSAILCLPLPWPEGPVPIWHLSDSPWWLCPMLQRVRLFQSCKHKTS